MKYLAMVLAGVALVVASTDGSGYNSRVVRAAPDSPADLMAKNILEWIQGIYRQGIRKTRQQENNGYLPPYSTQRPPEKPRPFQTASPAINEVTGYPSYQPSYTPQIGYSPGQPSQPPYGSTPPPSYIPPSPGPTYGSPPGFSSPPTSYNPRPIPSNPPRPFSGSTAGSVSGSVSVGYQGTSTTYLPPSQYPSTTGRPQLPPSPSYDYPSPNPSPAFPTPGGSPDYGYPSPSPSPIYPGPGGVPTGPGGSYGYPSPTPTPNFPLPGRPGTSTGGGTSTIGGGTSTIGGGSSMIGGGSSTIGGGSTTIGGGSSTIGGGVSTTGGGMSTTGGGVSTTGGGVSTTGGGISTTGGGVSTTGGGVSTTGGGVSTGTSATGPGGAGTGTATGSTDDDDLNHPPHIHNIEVECSKTMMTIDIEFNRNFDGVIYSKGFYMEPDCRYVAESSGQKEYSFTVSLDTCGTQFISDFEGEGQAYLENVLVLQNEPGIQEVWDTVRRVRCLWEGNINKALTVSLSVDMLNQEIVTFSGDTAIAKIDIQTGKGPFAPAANGLVKIGETMTLVVSVEGDPGFDLQVRDCVARDESSTNVVQLTDERGCILKPKLFGAFQKTKDTGNTGASIIAYAFFQAFKFPDVMDLFIECNVELCKTDCEACPEADQQIEPGRKRRDVSYASTNTSSGSLSDPVRMGRGFRVVMPDDLSLATSETLEKMEESALEEITLSRNVCMSYSGFYISFSLLLAILVSTTASSAIFYTKLQRITRSKNIDLPGDY